MLEDAILTYLKQKYKYNTDLVLKITEFVEYKTYVHVKFYMFDSSQVITNSGWMYHQELNVPIKDILMCDRTSKIKDILHE